MIANVKVFGHLVAVDHAAHGKPNPVLPLQASIREPGGDVCQIILSRLQELRALMSPESRHRRVVAGDEPLLEIVGVLKFHQILFIEEIGLEGFVFPVPPHPFLCGTGRQGVILEVGTVSAKNLAMKVRTVTLGARWEMTGFMKM